MPVVRSVPPDPAAAPPAEERGSRVMRFGAAVAAVLLSSAIATAPASVRVARAAAASADGTTVWLSLLALAFVPLAISTVALRHALAAVRLFDPRAVARGVATALLWSVVTFAWLVGLGAVLRATTHHHRLAGVTFGCVGVAGAAVLALVAARFVAALLKAPAAVRWTFLGAMGIILGVSLAFLARVIGRPDASSGLVIDLVAFAFGTAFGGGAFPHRGRPQALLALAGPPVATVVVLLGASALHRSAPLREAIREEAPVLAAASGLATLESDAEGAH